MKIPYAYRLIIWAALTVVLINSCAQPGMLTGGKEDTEGPKVVESESSPNYQVNFQARGFELVFDEYVELKSVFKQVLISPPMLNFPEIKQRGKKVTVKFNELEEIKENATYTFNFGEAIQDYRAGNKLLNYSYVFSTGPYIDSLSVKGTVVDFITKDGADEKVVLLYDNLSDSAVYKERPFYFAKTDKSGFFQLNNLKSDTFQIFVLDDQNLNYYLDGDTEAIAFMDSTFVLTDSFNRQFNIELAPVKPKQQLESDELVRFGHIAMKFSKNAERTKWSLLDSMDYSFVQQKDSLLIWFTESPDSLIQIATLGDTIDFRVKDRSIDSIAFKPYIGSQNATNNTAILKNQALEITFNTPIIDVDKSKIYLADTTQNMLSLSASLDKIDPRKTKIKFQLQADTIYEVILLPGAVNNIFGISNDTITTSLKSSSKEKFGALYPKFINLDSSKQYIIQLKQGERILERHEVYDQKQYTISVDILKPGQYSVEILEDRNRNGEWDSADYSTKTYPENIATVLLPELKANWEDNSEFDVQKILYGEQQQDDTESR